MARDYAKVDLNKRANISRTSYVTVVYWHWVKENFGTSSNVQGDAVENALIAAAKATKTGVIEGEISSCTISKNIDQSSASFNIALLPTQNWRQVISPGDWVAIYFHNGIDTVDGQIPTGTKNLVLLGNIDRVSRSTQKDEETDTTMLRYNISGRNFGKVFEQTDIWYDPYHTQDKTLDVMLRTAGLEIAGNPSKQIDAALNVFLGDGQQFKENKTTSLKQWMIPAGVATLFKGTGSGYFESILDRRIQENLPGFNPRNMITPDSNGSLWDFIKRSSNDLVNECYLEEVRDDNGNVRPTICLRPRPTNTPFFEATVADKSQFGIEDAKCRPMLRGAYKTLQRLSKESYVEISQSEIIYDNLGRDDHSRINMLWLKTSQVYQYLLSPTANIESKDVLGNPTFSRPSIHRHGLRRMDSILEFCHTEGTNGSEVRGVSTNINLFKAFIGQLYDMNYANHLYEQGTIECTGVLEAELGKALVVKSTVKNTPDKIYFIEGYEHKWNFPNTWTTTFTVTKGQFRASENIFIDVMGPSDFGQPDNSLDISFVAKTQGKK